MIHDLGGGWRAAAGTQLLVPTATQDQFGTGKWQLAPSIAAAVDLPGISRGSFGALLLREQWSFAGDDARADIHQLVVQPVLNINLPDLWFVTVAPELRLPFDLLVGKLVSPKTVVSIELKTAIVDDFAQYDTEVEVRVGFLF